MPIMDEARDPIFINSYLGGHASLLEEIDLLPVAFQDRMAGVRQSDERQGIAAPIQRKCEAVFGADHHDHGILCCEFVIILAQLRHVPSAVGSEKAAIENQEDILLCLEICEINFVSVEIGQREIWCGLIEFGAAHTGITRMTPKMISTTRLMTLD